MSAMHRGFALCTLALAAGCAPAEHTTDPTSSETAFQAGTLSGAVNGPIGSTQTTNSHQVTLTGVVANFTRLGIVTPGGATGTSAVYFSSRGDSGAPHVWRVNIDGTGLKQITTDSSGQVFPAIARAGNRLVFRDLGLSGGQPTTTDLWEWTPLGGSHFLASESGVTGVAGWVPGDTAVVYPINASGDVGLRERNPSGGAVTDLTEEPDRHVTTGLVNGVPTAYFTRRDSIYRVNLATHDTSLFHGEPSPFPAFGPDLSPDGSRVLFWTQDVRNFTLFSIPTDLSDSATQVTIIPDRGRPWRPEAHWSGDTAFVSLEENAQIHLPQLVLRHIQDVPLHVLTTFPSGVENEFSVGSPPAAPPRNLIGDGGELGSAASGIIYGLAAHGELTTVVSFTANRPRSVSLTAGTGLNASAPVLTYTLNADRLTALAYLADPPEGPAVPVIASSSAVVNGALITFDATTGEVALILPFATGGVTVADVSGVRVFRGAFTGVWQKGTDLANGGAGEVRLGWQSGQVEVRP
jgi:hypothetical protein